MTSSHALDFSIKLDMLHIVSLRDFSIKLYFYRNGKWGFQYQMASHTLLIKLWKEIYDIVVDGGVDGLVGRSLGGSSDWLWRWLWPMQSVRS